MEFLLTGAEIRELNGHYLVIYRSRILKNKMNKEEAIELALNYELLTKLYYGHEHKSKIEYGTI